MLFIDASQGFVKDGNKNKLRDEDVEKIIQTLNEFQDVEKFASAVDIDTIKENDYNLNISRYVDITEEEEQVDIPAVIKEIQELKLKITETEQRLNGYLKELGFEEI